MLQCKIEFIVTWKTVSNVLAVHSYSNYARVIQPKYQLVNQRQVYRHVRTLKYRLAEYTHFNFANAVHRNCALNS